MQFQIADKEVILNKLNTLIKESNTSVSDWKVGIASLQRVSLLNVQEEIYYQNCEKEIAIEIMFNLIAAGVQTCKMSKSNFNGIYLYR
ncbi:hypothetical protein JKA74_16990 [Marivirga sp. S37H4]|uniref:Uncharacterized protein n=1 Tax=Marivirga aurantiaca TaxID=2802615 RepID=A0A935CDB5_9BACT|nr:hypothetical protein [Marivirga aurantiaca]MBK6266743.1 hypothetical protein [Marivirga aurantiaca]